jgi:putative CocE/NonD family hydrolase
VKKLPWQIVVPVLAAVLLVFALTMIYQRKANSQMVSEFGKYRGYTEAIYDGTQRTSDYLTLADGTRLAYDLIIPTKKGVPADQPLPVLFKYTPYGRTWTIFDKNDNLLVSDLVDLPTKILARVRYWIMGDKGRIMDPLWRDRWLGDVVKHGYVVVSVDRPGTGASFASPTPGSMDTAATFESEIIDWIAAQAWSDGNVAMYGDSQQAMVQFAAAASGNPHLKAILPAASDIEIYPSVNYPGGVFNKAFASAYALATLLDKMATPVDSDPEGIVLAQAQASRGDVSAAQNTLEITQKAAFNDSIVDGANPWRLMDLYPFVDRINRGQTAVYMTVGWYDVFTADMFYWFNNLAVPKHLTVRPTDHSQVSANLSDLNYGTEALRWFDYWLKGIDNGIMDEPPIHYYLQDGREKGSWRTSGQWPMPTQELTTYYFAPGRSGTSSSVNDGGLAMNTPAEVSASDTYTVDYSTTTGEKSRWAAIEEAHDYPDMQAHDAQSLTYTTAPMSADMQMIGPPMAHLWLTTAAPDLDVFVYLEVVDAGGRATYLTEGNLRATHRRLGQPPFDNFGLPYQTHYQSDVEAIPAGEPFDMVFSLLPTAYQFHAGDRMRITISFADDGNFDTPVLDPAPKVTVSRDVEHPSNVVLPMVRD